MKLAYLASLYPAQSHTFIQREIEGLRALGFDISTYSIRRTPPEQILGESAEAEARRTRWLVPPAPGAFLRAIAWAVTTRPLLLARVAWEAVGHAGLGLRQRMMWACYLAEAILLAWWIRQEHADHLHCHFGNAGSNAAWLAAKLAGVPWSITFHGIDLDEPLPFRHAAKVAHARFAVCISKYGKSRLMYSCPPAHWHKIRIVHCGYAAPPEDALTPLPREPHIVSVARLSVEKGHLVLIEALRQLHAEGVRFRCTLAGDGPLRVELEQQVREAGLSNVITFAGALTPDAVSKLLHEAQVGVLASFGEGIPVALMEAMGHARPVIATCVGGIPELVRSGGNGLLVAPGSARDLAAALRDILSDYDRAAEMGQAGRQEVLARFRHDVAAQRLAALFRGRELP